MVVLITPWFPFVVSCVGRTVVLLSLILWVERIGFGIIPAQLRVNIFYGAVAFLVQAVVRSVFGGLFSTRPPDTKVHVETGSFLSGSVSWAACGMRGWREVMEDAHVARLLDPALFPEAVLFAVLDGHGGKEVSALAASILAAEVEACARKQLHSTRNGTARGGVTAPCLQTALSEALPSLDAKLRRGAYGLGCVLPSMMHPFFTMGSTACAVAVDLRSREVICANIGDSRAMLVRGAKDGLQVIALSEDHKPENPEERQRIQHAGGTVVKAGPCHRIDGNLNLSRAFGDFYLKANSSLPPDKQKVIAYPDCMRKPFKGGEEELLVIACDGLFERMSNQDIGNLVWKKVKSGMSLTAAGSETLIDCCARSYRGRPIEEGTDNESIIIVRLPPSSFRPGDSIEFQGLESEAGRELNGQEGVIVASSGDRADRFEVRVMATGEVKSFKGSNLRQVRVRLCPSGHQTLPWTGSAAKCDGCGAEVVSGEGAMSCKTCNSLSCGKCLAQQAKPQDND